MKKIIALVLVLGVTSLFAADASMSHGSKSVKSEKKVHAKKAKKAKKMKSSAAAQ